MFDIVINIVSHIMVVLFVMPGVLFGVYLLAVALGSLITWCIRSTMYIVGTIAKMLF